MPTLTKATTAAATSALAHVNSYVTSTLPILRRMGASVEAQRTRAQGSPNYVDGKFRAHEPTTDPGFAEAENPGGMPTPAGNPPVKAMLDRDRGKPAGTIPLERPALPATAADLAVTWLGHASSLVELDGHRFLLDPVFGERCSPSTLVGPRRLHPAPVPVADLPRLDAVVISHDHYDHLDEPTIVALERHHRPRYVVPIGVDEHLASWGVDRTRITALDWRESSTVGEITLTATEGRHFSGRGFVRDQTLWAGWALRGPRHSVWFAGDTGPSHRFEQIGRDLGPFDLTIVPIGAYSDYWPDIHVTPEQGIDAHVAVGGGVMLPIHWATFNLAPHFWSEPIRRARVDAAHRGVTLVTPRVGGRVDFGSGSATDLAHAAAGAQEDWWAAVAAAEDHD